MLQHRLIVPRQPVQGVESAADGLAVVLDTRGRVDVDEIARLMGVEVEQAITELGDQVFQVPGTDQWQTRAHFLSGDVRVKLDQARAAEVAEPGRWAAQVAALEGVRGTKRSWSFSTAACPLLASSWGGDRCGPEPAGPGGVLPSDSTTGRSRLASTSTRAGSPSVSTIATRPHQVLLRHSYSL